MYVLGKGGEALIQILTFETFPTKTLERLNKLVDIIIQLFIMWYAK